MVNEDNILVKGKYPFKSILGELNVVALVHVDIKEKTIDYFNVKDTSAIPKTPKGYNVFINEG
jgi:hypothetical protein